MFAPKETSPTLKEYDFWSYINYLFIGIDEWESRRGRNVEYGIVLILEPMPSKWGKIGEVKI